MNSQCELCGQIKKLTRHEKIARNAGGRIITENIIWICEECHQKINSITDSSIHKLKVGKEISSTVSFLQIGNVNVWTGSICCSSSFTPVLCSSFISNPIYVQGYPKDFDNRVYPFKILHNSGTFAVTGGSPTGYIYVSIIY